MRKLLQRVTAWFRKLDHEMEERVVGWMERRLLAAEASGRCKLCRHRLEPGETTRWSRFYGGLVHDLCIPSWLRTMGPEAVEVFLDRGPQPVLDAMTELAEKQAEPLQAVGQ